MLAIFEDECYPNFFPLTLTRPVYELRVGAFSLMERVVRRIDGADGVVVFSRKYLEGVQRERIKGMDVSEPSKIDDDVLLVNGLVIADDNFLKSIKKLSRMGAVLLRGNRVVAALLKGNALGSLELQSAITSASGISELILRSSSEKLYCDQVHLLEYPWELIELNSKLLEEDIRLIGSKEWKGYLDTSVTVYGREEDVYVEKDAFIEAGTVLDARNGPVYVGEGTHVHSTSRISGPAYIGRNCIIFGAQIRGGCSIGDVCRVGGEVEESIFQGYSNKRHYGYIGHSYIGEWVNMGAGTTCSDLKNTYGTIKMEVGGRRVDTNRIFLGIFVGDHTKTSIGTYIFSGKKIGVSCHLYGIVTEDVPSFTAYAKSLGIKPTTVFLDSALETARRVMLRRDKRMSEAYESMLRHVFEMTRPERDGKGVLEERLSF